MQSERQLGDIDLHDYLRIVQGRRPFRWFRALAIAGACVLAFTAGVLSPLVGKNADRRSLEEALEILERTPLEPEWRLEQAVFAINLRMKDALTALEDAARSDTQFGKDASIFLHHLARRSLDSIEDLAAGSPHSDFHLRSLDLIRLDLGPR